MGQRTRTVQSTSMVVVDGVLNRGRNREQIITILYLLFIDPEDQLVKNIEYISFPVLSCHQPDPSSRLQCICKPEPRCSCWVFRAHSCRRTAPPLPRVCKPC